MDRNFRLTEAGRRRAKHRIFRQMLIAFLIFQAVVLTCLFFFVRMTTLQIVVVIALAVIMLQVFVIRTWKNPAISFHDWGLHLGDNSIYLTAEPQESEIARDDIGALVESSNGLIIRNRRTGRQIWVPAGVEGYADVKRTLESWFRQRS